MEYSSQKLYEVEKIINRKYIKNKKYYLIKWLFYPINQSTWEPKAQLKHLKCLIDEFEAQYPYTIDKFMYNIFCNEEKNKKTIKKKEKINKNHQNINSQKKFLSKKRNIETFSEKELNGPYLNGLKIHLHIKVDKGDSINIKKQEEDFFIDLRGKTKEKEESLFNFLGKEKNENGFEETEQKNNKLIKPNVL